MTKSVLGFKQIQLRQLFWHFYFGNINVNTIQLHKYMYVVIFTTRNPFRVTHIYFHCCPSKLEQGGWLYRIISTVIPRSGRLGPHRVVVPEQTGSHKTKSSVIQSNPNKSHKTCNRRTRHGTRLWFLMKPDGFLYIWHMTD